MDRLDHYLMENRDWDPSYLRLMFSEDFYEFTDLWHSNVCDTELVQEMEKLDIYQPIVEDISMEDHVLLSAVEQIEKE